MNLREIVVSAMIAAGLFFSGCTTSYEGGTVQETRSFVQTSEQGAVQKKDYKTLDELSKSANELEKGLRYAPYLGQLNALAKEKRYADVENKVHELAKAFESVKDKEGSDILKRYAYLKIEYFSSRYEVTKSPTLNPLGYVGAASIGMVGGFGLPIAAASDDKEYFNDLGELIDDTITDKSYKTLNKEHYRIVRVSPYYKTDTVIEDNIPVDRIQRK